jgi:cysteine-rich repeat protein
MKRFLSIFLSTFSIFLIIGSIFCFLPEVTFAQTGDDFGLQPIQEEISIPASEDSDLRVTIVRIINIFLGFLGLIAFCIVLYAGYLWMTSGGSEERVSTAKKLLINGVIGLFIIMSAFAITSFILRTLRSAIDGEGGMGSGGSGGGSGGGQPTFCSAYPLQCCVAENFIVKSITPHTPEDVTGMNNVSVRVLFSRRVAGQPTDVFKIFRTVDGQSVEVTNLFTFSFVEDGSVVEARYTEGSVPSGDYRVEVSPDVRDVAGGVLTIETSCGTFGRSANFSTGDSDAPVVIDTTFDSLDPVSINGYTGDGVHAVVRGRHYPIMTTLRDTSGNGYAVVRVYAEEVPATIVENYIDGPRLSEGSSDAFEFSYGLEIDGAFEVGPTYVVEVVAYDIDGNRATDTVKFRVVPPSCLNGELDTGEVAVDEGGVCGGGVGSSCTTQSDCSYWYKCLDSQNNVCNGAGSCFCKAVPYISDVQYMNGAPGNWVTIFGRNFGSTPGTVQFDYDLNGNGSIDSSVNASLAQCRQGGSWNDSWIVAQVPLPAEVDSEEGVVNSPAISISDSNGLSDSTNDLFGPTLGLFTYNNTQRPNLCSVTVASDRVIPLDDGTAITVSEGATAAPQGTSLALEGDGFGDAEGAVLFDTADAPVSSWGGDLVNASVPFGVEDRIPVFISADSGERSNPVPFTIASIGDLFPPVITRIDPATTTKGSFVTISGNRFGNEGVVYFTQIENASCPGPGCILGGTLPAMCGDVWSDTQIVTRIPTAPDFSLGSYFIIVRRDDGVNTLSSSGADSVGVVGGIPAPSICRIDPLRGSAPLFDTDSPLTIVGENFAADDNSIKSIVRFWYPLGDAGNPDTWLSSSIGVQSGGASILRAGAEEIETLIPYDTSSGLSMSSGPVVVENNDGVLSNRVNYTVLDCREDSSGDKAGFECCTEGPEAGKWKHGNFACEGGTREAGYVWRFTTGKMPQKFVVAESCTGGSIPSPSPSVLWPEGANVCVNAQLQVKFNLPLDSSTIVSDEGILRNVLIRTCGGTADTIDCTESSDVTSQFGAGFMGEQVVIFEPTQADTSLLPNTWYRVALSENVTSLRLGTELGVTTQYTDLLEATKPCDISDSAYCFDFRTGPLDFTCTLVGAGLEPSRYTTTLLGVVQDSRYQLNRDLDRIFSIDAVTPLRYGVFGKSNLACTSINVDDKPWNWGPDAGQSATAAQLAGYPNSVGYATAWKNNPVGATIEARITESGEEIVATSTLIIDLGNPYAKSVWPSCLEACVNAEIGIEFSQLMHVSDYSTAHLAVRRCADETCAPSGLGPAVSLEIKTESQSQSVLRAYPESPLEKNSWYIVQMSEGIRALGGVGEQGETILGVPAEPKQWKFRTKDSEQLCLADSVRVLPDPFVSTYIGEAKAYRAFPFGSPDSCSPQGQILNPWNFGWEWSVENTGVAKVSDFSFSGKSKSTCTIGCTPVGSDVSRAQSTYPVCGNGIKESGEDCDIAIQGEIPGKSCTFSCLRPGNVVSGAGALQCGNGVVDASVGEECDPEEDGAISGFCTDQCVNAGSSSEATGAVGAPICGSGTVTYGEDCDITDPTSRINCSPSCMHLGTPVAQSWCDGYVRNPNDTRYSNVTRDQVRFVCGNATSVCGNGIIEQGEECESDVDGKDTCSERCLVQNACGTSAQQCVLGTEGCLSDCTLAGSSITYSTPSICGDGFDVYGNVGIGEYANEEDEVLSCEVESDNRSTVLGQNPVQVVTSVGEVVGDTAGVVGTLDTVVGARTTRVLTASSTVTLISPVAGEGDYYLKCGYTEQSVAGERGYNNCPANSDNRLGVATNSCCMERPVRVAEYPLANAGFGAGSAPVCRNTYVEVTFDQHIPIQNLEDSIELVQSYPLGYLCSTHGGSDVTLAMNDLLNIVPEEPRNVWVRVWDTIKNFFVRMVQINALAQSAPNQPLPADLVWCTANIPLQVKASYLTTEVGVVDSTVVSIYPSETLNSNSYVSVLLRGGSDGIRNQLGVSIKSPFGTELSDYWVFRTNDQICKIKEVVVEPREALYSTVNSSRDFIATAVSTFEDQKIVAVPGEYDWVWSWGPLADDIFDIPFTTSSQNIITSKGVRGHTDGIVKATVIADTSGDNNQQGKTYLATFSLDALFCQRPWPASGVDLSESVASTTALFKDTRYNFSLYYCADNGSPLSDADDLPFFDTIEVVTDPVELGVISPDDLPQALRRYLMFADKTDDAIGIQIFANPPQSDGTRTTLDQWYTERFVDLSAVTKTVIGGYDALMSDTSVYINAFNIDGETIYNNVYLFTIDSNATVDTIAVFNQLIDSLTFNVNLTNFGRCLREGQQYTSRATPHEFVDGMVCATDFDCREGTGEPKSGSNGFCSSAKSKFSRDVTRLEHLQSVQTKTDTQQQNSELSLSTGTYIPGYTNSKWPSWGKLGSIIGGAPVDPVNRWVGCDGHDPTTCWNVASTTFMCPVFAQTYEYSFENGSYRYHAPFEFIRANDTSFVSQYIDTQHVAFTRWCEPRKPYTPFGGQCGDGNINAGEQCDPPGQSITTPIDVNGQTCAVGSYAVATCNSNCQYTYGTCTVQSESCGNGILEGGEECDAGARNGQYGSRCTSACASAVSATTQSLATGQYCGNNTLDRNQSGAPLEFCEEVNGACLQVNANGQIVRTRVHVLLDRSGSMGMPVAGTGMDRWRNALAGLDQIYESNLNSVDFSLGLFPGTPVDGITSCYRELGVLTQKPSSAIASASILANGLNTPTRCAFETVSSTYNSIFTGSEDVPRKIILITDGKPSDALFPEQVSSIISQLNVTHNVSTYVIGFGNLSSAADKNYLNAFAEAGGTSNPNSTDDRFFVAERASEFVSAFGEILGCFEYSQFKQMSCSWNCQGYGEYCGDGLVQGQYGEECDQGVQNGNGTCSNYCKVVTPIQTGSVCGNNRLEGGEQCDDGNVVSGDGCSASCFTESGPPRCGNGPQGGENQPALDPGEQCDLGTANGTVCTPEYGSSCTYCSNTCTRVTVDAVAYCGNGVVDTDTAAFLAGQSAERCDFDSNNVYAFTPNRLEGGIFSLSNNKTPQVCPDKGTFACTNSCQTLSDTCVLCGLAANLPTPMVSVLNPMTQPGNSPFSHNEYVALFRKNPPGSSASTLAYLGYRKLNYRSPVETQANYIDPFDPYTLLIDGAFQPIVDLGLETSPLCNGEYALMFNARGISSEKTGGNETALSAQQISSQGFADLFDYSVQGEGGRVVNEVVLSPAVPSYQTRIVVRWEKKSGGALFTGNFYQDGATPNTISYISGSGTQLCGEMTQNAQGYYVPTNCNTIGNSTWAHRILNPDSTTYALQAFTLSAVLRPMSTIGFYVSSPNGPINQFKDYNVWVDVYEFHEGQVPEYSVYKPTHSFSIKNAVPSSNSIARYWHVFNLSITSDGDEFDKKFTITPINGASSGSIVTGECQVRERMPNTTQCQTQ